MTATSEAPPAGGVTRRRELGTASARSLLLTVLGEFVLPSGGDVWTSSVLQVLAELGVEEKAARQALMRVSADGWITASKHGRRTRRHLTPSGEQLLADGTRRIFSFASAVRHWDGTWLLLSVDLPEGQRALRQRLRTKLSWVGFGSLPGGLWISARQDRAAEASAVIAELGLAEVALSFRATSGGIGTAEEMVRRAWILDEIASRYDDFLELVSTLDPQEPRQTLADQIRLVQEWRRFPFLDPGLPRQFLPEHWSGTRAAELFHHRHAAWSDQAWTAWRSLDAG
jgi:phenylacetic acid degradation operon negative regulatory protein